MAKLYWRVKKKNGKWTWIRAIWDNTDNCSDPEDAIYQEEEE